MSKVMATALSMAVSTKEGDGNGLEHGRRKPRAWLAMALSTAVLAKEGNGGPIFIMSKVMATASSTAVSAKEGDGGPHTHHLLTEKIKYKGQKCLIVRRCLFKSSKIAILPKSYYSNYFIFKKKFFW
jgi:hypothetical protein